MSSAYLRLLIFLPATLIPACASSSQAFHMMYSAYKLNKQGDYIQPWHAPLSIFNQSVAPCQVLTDASWFATVSQEAGKVVWYPHLLNNFPQFVVIHTVKGFAAAAAAAKSRQSCPTLCDPIDGSPPGSPGPGILQIITLEWDAISFSNAWKWKVKVKSLSHVRLLANPWTAVHQAPLSMGFSRQEYCNGVQLPSPKRL